MKPGDTVSVPCTVIEAYDEVDSTARGIAKRARRPAIPEAQWPPAVVTPMLKVKHGEGPAFLVRLVETQP